MTILKMLLSKKKKKKEFPNIQILITVHFNNLHIVRFFYLEPSLKVILLKLIACQGNGYLILKNKGLYAFVTNIQICLVCIQKLNF
jgi:hypothetical protein